MEAKYNAQIELYDIQLFGLCSLASKWKEYSNLSCIHHMHTDTYTCIACRESGNQSRAWQVGFTSIMTEDPGCQDRDDAVEFNAQFLWGGHSKNLIAAPSFGCFFNAENSMSLCSCVLFSTCTMYVLRTISLNQA